MNDTTAQRVITGAFMAEIAFITWQEISQNKQMPQPKRYVGAAVITTVLQSAAGFIGPELAAIFAVGFAIGIIYHQHTITAKLPVPQGTGPGQSPDGIPPSGTPQGPLGNGEGIPGVPGSWLEEFSMDDIQNLLVIMAGGTLAAVILAHGIVPKVADGLTKLINGALNNAQGNPPPKGK
jgi:hypothetical protein